MVLGDDEEPLGDEGLGDADAVVVAAVVGQRRHERGPRRVRREERLERGRVVGLELEARDGPRAALWGVAASPCCIRSIDGRVSSPGAGAAAAGAAAAAPSGSAAGWFVI